MQTTNSLPRRLTMRHASQSFLMLALTFIAARVCVACCCLLAAARCLLLAQLLAGAVADQPLDGFCRQRTAAERRRGDGANGERRRRRRRPEQLQQ